MNENDFIISLLTLNCTECNNIISKKGLTEEKLLEFSENYSSI